MQSIDINEFTYPLPPDRIAAFPLAERDQSKLLHYQAGKIQHRTFLDLPDLLPDHSLLVFNNTKVIPARLFFEKESGATIELLLLQPVAPSSVMSVAMEAKRKVTWHCAIGNLKRWPNDLVLEKKTPDGTLYARLENRTAGHVEISWEPAEKSFAEIVQQTGITPLPPYIKRAAQQEDRERYQTVYAQWSGAVAAPTAGLHFTERVLEKLRTQNVQQEFVTLHVSAGTFQPVKVSNAVEHDMHAEQVVVSRNTIVALLRAKNTVVVGTTSMRTLESLYWFGVLLHEQPTAGFYIPKLYCYETPLQQISRVAALQKILEYMQSQGLDELLGHTSIYLFPGYRFRMCDGLITNFHQPGSTLMLLVAAFIGPDWKKVYQAALDHQYRFLSYGDSSLLIPHPHG
jgi:S-adenosylmethionine:tRNA ribosyltransferase-isomerase